MKLIAKRGVVVVALSVELALAATVAQTGPAHRALLDTYVASAKTADPTFAAFSAEKGKQFFHGTHKGGKPELTSCTTCHTDDPRKPGRTRAGKEIGPIAVSANAKRFTDRAEVEKWFKRNCNDVLGRDCTVIEKGDVIAYLLGI